MAYCLETGFNFGSNTISSVLAVCIFQLTRAGQDLLMCVCMNCDQVCLFQLTRAGQDLLMCVCMNCDHVCLFQLTRAGQDLLMCVCMNCDHVCIFQLTRAGQDLLMCVCMNCDQLHSQSDAEVTNILTKIRLKTKLLVNHYLLSMRLPDVRFLFMQFSCTFSLHVALWLMSLLI